MVMENKKSTDELKKILKSSKTYNDFLEKEKEELIFTSISEFIKIEMTAKGIKATELIRGSNLDKGYVYQILRGARKSPSRDAVLSLAFGLRLNSAGTDKMLRIAEYDALYIRRPRDGIIMHCLDRGVSLTDTNIMLSEKGLEPIGKF